MPSDETPASPRLRRLRWIPIAALAAGAVVFVYIAVLAPEMFRGDRNYHAEYVGDAACASCHQEQADSYRSTAHATTSAHASADTVHGHLPGGTEIFRTGNPDLHFRLEARGGEFFQTAVRQDNASGQVLTRTERMDIVIGSGRKGQTYLYWDDNLLFQLPVSYWAEQGLWVNSPGFVDGEAKFDRPIVPRCLECHGSSFVSTAPPVNAFEKPSLVLGVSCEKCHGPGSEHVARYRSAAPPESVEDAAIINPARLARDRQTDLCSLCHAGLGEAHTPPLSFQPGDVLAEHLTFPPQRPGAHIDVHASQVQLMESSRCFQASPAMTCTTCHDVHRPQRDLTAMAASCMQCHEVQQCGDFLRRGHAIATRCIDCHMPLEKTDQIVIEDGVAPTMRPQVRNHRIAIYPEASAAEN